MQNKKWPYHSQLFIDCNLIAEIEFKYLDVKSATLDQLFTWLFKFRQFGRNSTLVRGKPLLTNQNKLFAFTLDWSRENW